MLLCYEQSTYLNTKNIYTQCINDNSTINNKAINITVICNTIVTNGKNEYYDGNKYNSHR